MRRDQLEHAIRTACRIIERPEVIVVGSRHRRTALGCSHAAYRGRLPRLADEGWLIVLHGRGTFVARRRLTSIAPSAGFTAGVVMSVARPLRLRPTNTTALPCGRTPACPS
jgi:hypothetical protein